VETIWMTTMMMEVKQEVISGIETVCSIESCLFCTSGTSFTNAQSQTKKVGAKDENTPSHCSSLISLSAQCSSFRQLHRYAIALKVEQEFAGSEWIKQTKKIGRGRGEAEMECTSNILFTDVTQIQNKRTIPFIPSCLPSSLLPTAPRLYCGGCSTTSPRIQGYNWVRAIQI
jgi:hypothetical protein